MCVRNLSFVCGLGGGRLLNIAKNILVLILPSSYPKQVPNNIREKCYSDICGTCCYYNFVKKNSEGTTWIMKDIRVDANIQMSFYTSALNAGIYLKFRQMFVHCLNHLVNLNVCMSTYTSDKINETMNWFRHLNLCERFAFKVPEKPKPYWMLQQKLVWLLTNIYGYWRHRVLEYQPNMPPVRFHWEQ